MMKYTNYIINGNIVDIDQLISTKPGWKQVSILVSIPVAIMGLSFFTGALPFAISLDGVRILKLKYILYMRNYRRDKYFIRILSPLKLSHDYQNYLNMVFLKGRDEILMNSTVKMNDISIVPFKVKLQYILSKGSYILTDQQVNTFKTLDKGLNKSYIFVKQTLRQLRA